MSRPTRTHSARLISGLSLAFFIFLAVVCLCPPAVSAEDKKSEYGTVIGIGTYPRSFFFFFPLAFSLSNMVHLFLSQIWEQRTCFNAERCILPG